MSRSLSGRARGAALAAACAFALAGCIVTEGGGSSGLPKHLQPIPQQTLALMEQKGMDKDSPILLRIFKEESELEIWKQARDGKYALLKSFPICRWSGELGPKIREGDRQAPEGIYAITPELMNPWSNFHLAFNLGYPNEFDRAHGRTGSHLMVHGDCSSAGCYAMTDEQISEIFALARESFNGGQLAFQVHAFPFRMTPRNMARHRNNPHLPFWRMLKEGYDHFEITRRQPKIDVCERRYLFNAHLLDPSQPVDPRGVCPAYEVPQEIAVALRAKQEADERQFQVLARIVPAAPVVTGRDGGTHQAFAGGRLPSAASTATETAAATAAVQVAPPPAAASALTTTGSTRRPATAAVPPPPSDPRRPGEDYVRRALASKGQAAPQSRPASSAASAQTEQAGRSAPETERASAYEQERPASGSLPGATPILSTGGFSSFR